MTIVLESKSGHRLEEEESIIASHLTSIGQTYRIASYSQVERGRVDTTKSTLVVGTIPFVRAALRQRGIRTPVVRTYPPALEHLLHRKIWPSNVRRALEYLELSGRPFFLKPASRAKRFTGFVINDDRDYRLNGVSRSELVWCSEVVHWQSEWRLYVVQGVVVHSACYEGDQELPLSPEAIGEALSLIGNDPDMPATYTLDVGVLSTGQTALIEVNDGYSIGAYGFDGEGYYSFLKSRWDQLCAIPPNCCKGKVKLWARQ